MKYRFWSVIFLFVVVVGSVVLAVCFRNSKRLKEMSPEVMDDVREAIVRHYFPRELSEKLKEGGHLFFLSFDNRADPSENFMRKIRDIDYVVIKKYSDCESQEDGTVIDRRTRKRGAVMSMVDINRVSAVEIIAELWTYSGPLAGRGDKLCLKFESGRWKVEKMETIAVS
ncbi:MAG: hypothetical protein V1809_09140 [Planctomycetota bacterium]